MRGQERLPYSDFHNRVVEVFCESHLISVGPAPSIVEALNGLGTYGFHGALDPVEGAVWRIERKGMVDFLVKYVRTDKVDGSYLPEISGKEPIWNWRPVEPNRLDTAGLACAVDQLSQHDAGNEDQPPRTFPLHSYTNP